MGWAKMQNQALERILIAQFGHMDDICRWTTKCQKRYMASGTPLCRYRCHTIRFGSDGGRWLPTFRDTELMLKGLFVPNAANLQVLRDTIAQLSSG